MLGPEEIEERAIIQSLLPINMTNTIQIHPTYLVLSNARQHQGKIVAVWPCLTELIPGITVVRQLL